MVFFGLIFWPGHHCSGAVEPLRWCADVVFVRGSSNCWDKTLISFNSFTSLLETWYICHAPEYISAVCFIILSIRKTNITAIHIGNEPSGSIKMASAIYRQQKVLSHFPVCCWIDWLLMIKNCLIESGSPCIYMERQ
jgi:hypothetical protein